MPDPLRFIQATAADGSRLFAGVDPSARFTEARLSPSRLGAALAPYIDESAARAALVAAGGADVQEHRR